MSDNVKKILKKSNKVEEIAKKYSKSKNFLYLSRGYNFPVTLEGALKLKEISYIHAEDYPAAEMKHGPIALIDKNMPVVVVATKKGNYKKIVSNVMEIKAEAQSNIHCYREAIRKLRKFLMILLKFLNLEQLVLFLQIFHYNFYLLHCRLQRM